MQCCRSLVLTAFWICRRGHSWGGDDTFPSPDQSTHGEQSSIYSLAHAVGSRFKGLARCAVQLSDDDHHMRWNRRCAGSGMVVGAGVAVERRPRSPGQHIGGYIVVLLQVHYHPLGNGDAIRLLVRRQWGSEWPLCCREEATSGSAPPPWCRLRRRAAATIIILHTEVSSPDPEKKDELGNWVW